jgi:hypothetical protein
MPRLLANFNRGQPLLDIRSYARPGPARRDRLSSAEVVPPACKERAFGSISRSNHSRGEIQIQLPAVKIRDVRDVDVHDQRLTDG